LIIDIFNFIGFVFDFDFLSINRQAKKTAQKKAADPDERRIYNN
jgi:hypothetical protein